MTRSQAGLAAVLVHAALFVVMFVLGRYSWSRWLRRRHGEVDRMVRDGEAQWAAVATIWIGAEHLGGAVARRGSRPTGIVAVSDGWLVWHPGERARRRRHQTVRLPLTDVAVDRTPWWRPWTSVARFCQLMLATGTGRVLIHLYSEAGVPPTSWPTPG
jgi:hypothetical protein